MTPATLAKVPGVLLSFLSPPSRWLLPVSLCLLINHEKKPLGTVSNARISFTESVAGLKK